MSDELLDILRTANREFQDFVGQVALNGVQMIESRRGARRLGKISARLRQVAELLAAGNGSSPAGGTVELIRYRDTLRALRNALETLQFSLLSEKARLEQLQGNLRAAEAWAASLRETS